jgi:hypothetical protein
MAKAKKRKSSAKSRKTKKAAPARRKKARKAASKRAEQGFFASFLKMFAAPSGGRTK